MSFKWFTERPKFTIVAVAILLLLILLFISTQTGGKGNPIGNGIRTVISAIQKPFAEGMNLIELRSNNSMNDEELAKKNEELQKQIDELQKELTNTRIESAELEELRTLASLLDSKKLTDEFTLQAASIISFSSNRNVNLFTVDIGSEAGVKRDTIAVNGDGLIGRVITTSRGVSTVLSIIDETNKIGFEVNNEQSFIGICQGNGEGILTGEMIDDEAVVNIGDKVYTSGMGGIYPQGILIGEIIDKRRTEDSTLLTVDIEPSVYFRGLKKVVLLI